MQIPLVLLVVNELAGVMPMRKRITCPIWHSTSFALKKVNSQLITVVVQVFVAK